MQAPRWLKVVGYPAWFSLCFSASLYLTLPLNLARQPLTDALEQALGKGKQGRHGTDPKVTIDKIKPWRFTGVELERVQLQLASDDPDPGPTIDLDEIYVRVGFFSLLFNAPTVKFDVELYDGNVAGAVSLVGDKAASDQLLGHTRALLGGKVAGVSALDVDLSGVDLGRAPPLVEKVGVPISGKAEGTVHLELGEQPEKDAKGKVDLAIKAITLGPGELKIPVPGLTGGLTLPLIDMGDLIAKADVKEGNGTFEQLGLTGKDFSADLDGNLRLARKLDMSRLDTTGWFLIAEAFLEQNSKFKTIIDFAQPLKRVRDDEGKYPFTVKGTLAKPRFDLGKGSSRGSRPPMSGARPPTTRTPPGARTPPKPTEPEKPDDAKAEGAVKADEPLKLEEAKPPPVEEASPPPVEEAVPPPAEEPAPSEE